MNKPTPSQFIKQKIKEKRWTVRDCADKAKIANQTFFDAVDAPTVKMNASYRKILAALSLTPEEFYAQVDLTPPQCLSRKPRKVKMPAIPMTPETFFRWRFEVMNWTVSDACRACNVVKQFFYRRFKNEICGCTERLKTTLETLGTDFNEYMRCCFPLPKARHSLSMPTQKGESNMKTAEFEFTAPEFFTHIYAQSGLSPRKIACAANCSDISVRHYAERGVGSSGITPLIALVLSVCGSSEQEFLSKVALNPEEIADLHVRREKAQQAKIEAENAPRTEASSLYLYTYKPEELENSAPSTLKEFVSSGDNPVHGLLLMAQNYREAARYLEIAAKIIQNPQNNTNSIQDAA